MERIKHVLAVLLLVLVVKAEAQHPAPSPVKWKPPKAHSFLGTYKDTVTLSVEDARQAVSKPLKVTDDKKADYAIINYQCLYRRITVTEDEQTGKTMPATSQVVQTFKTTPLSDLWIKTINEQLQPGEQIYFFDIVAKDAQGLMFFAPSLLIIVK